MSRRPRRGDRRGFTLMELLIVVAIIAILISVLMPATQVLRQRAKEKQRDATQAALAHALRSFRTEYGYWPGSDQDPTAAYLNLTNQIVIIRNYLLSGGVKNPRNKEFWDLDQVVTNVVTKKPFGITIDVVNDSVSVQ